MYHIIVINDGEKLLFDCQGAGQYFTLEDLLVLQKKVKNSIRFAMKNDITAINNKLMEDLFCRARTRTRTRKRPPKSGFIYVMRDNHCDRIKIGFSKNPTYREATLQAQKPDIELVFQVKGTISDERRIHEYFNDHRIRGEWFSVSAEIVMEYIKTVFCDRFHKNINAIKND